MLQKTVEFEKLSEADLIVDCLYRGGSAPNLSASPFTKLLPKCPINGGIRAVNRSDGSGLPAYVVLYTSMAELEWPDFLDVETGILRYYGDNRTAGSALMSKRGNRLLSLLFEKLNSSRPEDRRDIPPVLVFSKGESGRDVVFRGLAAPGSPRIPPDRDLIAFWRTLGSSRFQNFESYFTILDTGDAPISRRWLSALIDDHCRSLALAPQAWRDFVASGRDGIRALAARKIPACPSRDEQLAGDAEGRRVIERIRAHFAESEAWQGFEACAADIVAKMDRRFSDFRLTRPWRDGGRDALGYYDLGLPGSPNRRLRIDFALEAKCYAASHGVSVHDMSRLISRIRYRQFGVLVTTSYVNEQAYREVTEDGHPILIVTGRDVASVLRMNSVTSRNVERWIESAQDRYARTA